MKTEAQGSENTPGVRKAANLDERWGAKVAVRYVGKKRGCPRQAVGGVASGDSYRRSRMGASQEVGERDWSLYALSLSLGCVVWGALPVVGAAQGAMVGIGAFGCTVLGVAGYRLCAGENGLEECVSQLKLGPLFCLTFAAFFGLASLLWLGPSVAHGYANVSTGVLPNGLLVAGIGAAAFVGGYCFIPRGAPDQGLAGPGSAPVAWSGQMSVTHVLFFFGVALVGHMYYLRTGAVGYVGDPSVAASGSMRNIVAATSQFGMFATLLAWGGYSLNPSLPRLVLAVVVLLEGLAIGLASGMRENAMLPALCAFLGYGLYTRVRLIRVGAGFLIALLLFTAVVNNYRDIVNDGERRATLAEVVERIEPKRFAQDSLSDLGESFFSLSWRLTRAANVGMIVAKSPEVIPFRTSLELLQAPAVGLVPRSVWPDKPVLDAGYQVNQEYYGKSGAIRSSEAVTPYGDLWRHGGWSSVLLGMLFLGWAVRFIDTRSASCKTRPSVLFLPLILGPLLLKQEKDFVGLMAAAGSAIVVSAVATLVVDNMPGGGRSRPAHAERR